MEYLIQALLSPFRVNGRIWLHQQSTPLVFYLKQDGVRICLKIVCSRFYEKAILNLSFENDHVQVNRLAILTEYTDIIIRAGKIIFFSGWRAQVIVS